LTRIPGSLTMPNVTEKSFKVNIMGFFSLQFSSYRENPQVIQKVKISLY
jgi:hypothetical protein